MDQPLVIEVAGSYRDQGRQHGEALAGVIAEIIAEIVPWDRWDHQRVDSTLAVVEANLRRHAPWLLQDMLGIAEGAGLTYREVLAYNAVVDISAAHAACTAMAWAQSPEGPIIGKTNDIGKDMGKYHQVIRRSSGEGLAALWFTWPGAVWGAAFVNEAGLAYGGASLTMRAQNPAGIPSNCALRVLCDVCGSVDDVLTTLEHTPVMHHPAHCVLSHCGHDGIDTTVALEMTPEGTFVCQGTGRPYVAVTNHFCPGPYEGKDGGEERHKVNSRRRLANLERLAQATEPGLDAMHSVLTDHAASGGICQHGQEDMWSSAGFIMLPRQRRMLAVRGLPCEGHFTDVVL